MAITYRACAKIHFDDGCAQQYWGPCRETLVLAEGDTASMRSHFDARGQRHFEPGPISITTWIQTIDSQAEVELNRLNYTVGYEWPIS